VKVIQVPCTGRVDIIHLLNAFIDGADGVYVAGCLEGECHFSTGNIKARKKVNYVKKVLSEIGIEPERVAMYNLSSAQGSGLPKSPRKWWNRSRPWAHRRLKKNKTGAKS
jgi:F420-non-reducing hydrogenase iron-sulfur subunit